MMIYMNKAGGFCGVVRVYYEFHTPRVFHWDKWQLHWICVEIWHCIIESVRLCVWVRWRQIMKKINSIPSLSSFLRKHIIHGLFFIYLCFLVALQTCACRFQSSFIELIFLVALLIADFVRSLFDSFIINCFSTAFSFIIKEKKRRLRTLSLVHVFTLFLTKNFREREKKNAKNCISYSLEFGAWFICVHLWAHSFITP